MDLSVDIEWDPAASECGIGAVGMSADCDDEGCPMGFLCPSRGWTDHAGCVELTGCVLEALWAHVLQGSVRLARGQQA